MSVILVNKFSFAIFKSAFIFPNHLIRAISSSCPRQILQSDYDPRNQKNLVLTDKTREIKGVFKEDFNPLGQMRWYVKVTASLYASSYLALNIIAISWIYLVLHTPGAEFVVTRLDVPQIYEYLSEWGADQKDPKLMVGIMLWLVLQPACHMGSRIFVPLGRKYLNKWGKLPEPKYARFKNEKDYECDDTEPYK